MHVTGVSRSQCLVPLGPAFAAGGSSFHSFAQAFLMKGSPFLILPLLLFAMAVSADSVFFLFTLVDTAGLLFLAIYAVSPVTVVIGSS